MPYKLGGVTAPTANSRRDGTAEQNSVTQNGATGLGDLDISGIITGCPLMGTGLLALGFGSGMSHTLNDPGSGCQCEQPAERATETASTFHCDVMKKYLAGCPQPCMTGAVCEGTLSHHAFGHAQRSWRHRHEPARPFSTPPPPF